MEIGQTVAQRPWISAKEAADYMGVTTNTLRSYLKQRKNRPPVFRLGGKPQGRLCFPREQFIQWANGGLKG